MATTEQISTKLIERFEHNIKLINNHIHKCKNEDISNGNSASSTCKGSASGGKYGKICIAISGGSDSTALLTLAAEALGKESICALTFDHQLRKESAQESQVVARFAKSIGISHHTIRWSHSLSAGNIQHRAREARYNAIALFCRANGIKIALTGHTIDDQIETYIMRKNHGSTTYGLAGMSATRPLMQDIYLARPLLNITRIDLRHFLQNHNISWCEDPSNQNTLFERIRTRQYLQQLYQTQGYLGTTQNIIEQIKHHADMRISLEERATQWIAQNAHVRENVITFPSNNFIDASTSGHLTEHHTEYMLQSEILHRMLQHITCNRKRLTHQQIQSIVCSISNHITCSISHCLIREKHCITTITPEKNRHNHTDKTFCYTTHQHQYCITNYRDLYITNAYTTEHSERAHKEYDSIYSENTHAISHTQQEHTATNIYHIFSSINA